MKQGLLTRLIVAITMIFFISITAALAQGQIQLQLLTRKPMPERISDWRQDPSLIQLRITNPAGNQEYRDARVSFEVKNVGTGKIVVRSKDGSPQIPSVTVGKGYSVKTLFGRDLIDPNSVEIDPSVRTIALATNSLPEGNYSFCIRLLNSAGQPIPTIGGCSNLTILHPRPPTLILPSDHQVFLPSQLPNFQWAPAQRVTGSYRLRIVPVYQNQSDQNAIQVNPPVLDKNVGNLLSYQYLASDPSFINYFGTAYGFAWQVSITDPVSGQTYASTVRHFTFGSNSPLIGMQNIANGSWIIQWNPGNGGGGNGGGNGGGGNGGGNGGGGNGGNNKKGIKDLGNIGTVQSTCDKARSFRIWMNFGNMGFNTFPMDVLGISGVDPTVADVSYDASGRITIKCKNTGSFTIDVWIRALPLGLSPFKDVYKVSITIDCRCGKPGKGKGKKGKGGGDDDDSDDDDGKDKGSEDGSNDGSENGDDPTVNDDPCKRLKALEEKITEAEAALKAAEEAAQKAARAAANSDQAKKDCQENAKRAQEELDRLNKEVDDLRSRQEQLLKQIKEIHDNDGVNFGWSYNSRTGELTYGAIVNGNFIEGIVPSAWNQVKELQKINKQLKEKLAERNRKQAEVENQKKECEGLEKKLKEEREEREEKMKEVDKAVDELEKLRGEYEKLKKDCDKKGESAGDAQDGSDGGDKNSGQSESGDSGSDETGDKSGTTGGDTDGTSNGTNGDVGGTTDDPCEKLKEVEKRIEELKREIEQAASEKGNLSELEDAKAELERELEKAESDLDHDWKIWEKLGKMTDEAFQKYGENSDEYRSLKRNRDNYLAEIQKHQDRIRELKKRLKETQEKLDKAKEAADREEKARRELEKLTKEYEQLKKECDKPGSSSNRSGAGTAGEKGGDNTEGSGSGKKDVPGQNGGGTSGTGGNGGTEQTGRSDLIDEDDPCEKLADVEDRIRTTEELLAKDKAREKAARQKLAELEQQLQAAKARSNRLKETVLAQGVDKTTVEYQEWERSIGEEFDLESKIKEVQREIENATWGQPTWEKALEVLRAQYEQLKKECDERKNQNESKGENSSNEGEGTGGAKQETERNSEESGKENITFTDGFESGDVSEWFKFDVGGIKLNPQCVDCSKIVASRGTGATGGMIIAGRPGSVPPNSPVTITDANGKSVTVTAGADGSFRAVEADLPDGFDHTVGNKLTVSAGGKSCEVAIQR